MTGIKINDIDFLIRSNISILESCKYVGINIPRFCYHEILSVSGNCRMCLVEVENLEKAVASCVTEIEEGMSIWVDTPFVKKARENVLEALLLNHPLDCPICDQAGECDLQDQTKIFGGSYSRFFLKKKVVEDKSFGPLIKTIMTRCISCTRCVRYASEIAGIEYFGTLNRGVETEISSYTSKAFESEISGNVIDLCPVGALTSKPYTFKARPWELRLCESIDTTDSLGSNIYINYKGTEISRILPKSNINLNGNIISDKARFSYDSNTENRVTELYSYCSQEKRYSIINWEEFFDKIDTFKKFFDFNFFIDEKCDFETSIFLKRFINRDPRKCKLFCINKNNLYNNNIYISTQLNILNKLEKEGDVIILLGCNPKLENTVLNSKIRFKFKNIHSNIKVLGMSFEYNIESKFINLNFFYLVKTLEAKNSLLTDIAQKSRKQLLLAGENLFDRINSGNSFLNQLSKIFPALNLIKLINNRNSDGLNWFNIKKLANKRKNENKIAFFLNLNDNIVFRKTFDKFNKKVWINTHGSLYASKSNIIVPMFSPYETEETYLNLEHRSQTTQKITSLFPILKSLKNIVYSIGNFKNINCVNKYENYSTFLKESLKNSEKYNFIKNILSPIFIIDKIFKIAESKVILLKYPIKQKIKNFYFTDNLTRNSIIMKSCFDEYIKNSINFNS